MNEEVMCGHPAGVLWTSCRGYVVRKVGIELLWHLKRLQNLVRHVVMALKWANIFYQMLKMKRGVGG